jgi:hypothetical protein
VSLTSNDKVKYEIDRALVKIIPELVDDSRRLRWNGKLG